MDDARKDAEFLYRVINQRGYPTKHEWERLKEIGEINDPTPTKESIIVDEIIRDLCDRRGLRQEWEEIDRETQEEIKTKWKEIIRRADEINA